jgi:hypothetical protein
MMGRVAALACVLASLQAVGGNQLGDLGKLMTQLQSAAVNADNGNPLKGDAPTGQSSTGMPNLVSLFGGGGNTAPKQESRPQEPNTLIRYVPGEKPGEDGHCDTLEVPADANIIVLDGRVQVGCPKSKNAKTH